MQVFLPWVTTTTRLWAGARHIEVEWTAGPIPYKDGLAGGGGELPAHCRPSQSQTGFQTLTRPYLSRTTPRRAWAARWW